MSTYKLQYFDARGVVEVARFMFAVAKVDYDDARFSLTFGTPGDFSTLSRPEFDSAKAAGELACSAGKVPYLEVNGVKFGQSKAIERYLAKELGLGGSSPIEFAQMDAVAEQVRDIKDAYNNAKRGKEGAEKEAALKTWFDETMPAQVKLMESMVPGAGGYPGAGGPFLFGSKVSYADLSVFQFLAAPSCFFDNTEGAAASFKDCPKIASAMAAVFSFKDLESFVRSAFASVIVLSYDD